MKKALVVFLILAVAGGLFAQTTVKFSGSVQTGLAIGFTDMDDDKPMIDYIRNRGEHGIRGDFSVNIASGDENSPYGKFGGTILLRNRDSNIFNADGLTSLAPSANIWWTPNSFVKIHIGTDGDGGYGTMGGIDRSQDVNGGTNGLKINLTPVAGLGIAGTMYYGQNLQLFENTNYGFGVKYAVPSLLNIAANARYLAQNKDDKTEKIRFGAGVNFVGLSGMGLTTLAADFGSFGFGTDDFFMGIGEKIVFATGGLTIQGKFGQYLWLGKDDKDVFPMFFHGEVAYKVNSIVTVGVEGRYLIGGKPQLANGNNGWRNASEAVGIDSVANFSAKDTSGLTLSPSITLNVGPQIVLGVNFRKDLSEGATPTATTPTQAVLIYTGVNLSF